MDSPGGNSSMSSKLQSSGSEGELQALMDQRKRKRMQSNRESAKRSRMRKQKHLDDLMGQVNELRKENGEIITSINITTQHYVKVEAENSVLRAQMAELSNRLQSLNDILSYINTSNGTFFSGEVNGRLRGPVLSEPGNARKSPILAFLVSESKSGEDLDLLGSSSSISQSCVVLCQV